MTRLFFIFFLLVAILDACGQKQIEARQQTWFGYFNQTRFTTRSGLWVDLHMRLTDEFLNKKSLGISRLGYTYYVSNNFRITGGYGFIIQYSPNGGPDIPEHRLWQQIMWIEKKPRLGLMQYLRVEERFRRTVVSNELTDENLFNWRFRYNISMTVPLRGGDVLPGTPFLFLSDEIHINAGKNIINNYFDQNRLFVGVGYQFTPSVNAQAGYLYVFQQLPAATQFVHIDAIRLFVYHTLDLRRE